jgi:anti-anti-sigma factor
MTIQTLNPSTESVLPMVELRLVGPLDVSSLIRLGEQIDDAVSLAPNRLVVDLSQCDYMDAQAIRVLLDGHRAMWRQGGRLLLRGANPAAMRLLSIAGVQHVFTFDDRTDRGLLAG